MELAGDTGSPPQLACRPALRCAGWQRGTDERYMGAGWVGTCPTDNTR